MSKQLKNQTYIYKIQAKWIIKSKFNYKLSIKQAKANKQLTPLADSQTLRFINDILELENNDDKINEIKECIDGLKRLEATKEIKKEIKRLYEEKDKLHFLPDYVNIEFATKKEFDECIKNGVKINGVKFYRLLGTTSGIKHQTIIFVSERVYDELNRRIENGRNVDKPLIPAKLEAYKALTCSASIPVTMPKGILVVDDCITNFKEDVIKIEEVEGEKEPSLQIEKDFDVELIDSDGYGLIRPTLARQWGIDIHEVAPHESYIPTGFCIRNAFTKGMVFSFDFEEFAKSIANENYIVKDVWGQDRDVREVELILTTSMLKLWDSYSSLEDYLENCNKNRWTFSVTKMCPRELEHERTFNYQFLQSFELSDEDIQELIKPTVDSIKDALGEDYVKTMLFLRGTNVTSKSAFHGQYDYVKALMVEEKLLKDPYVIDRVHSMINKRIQSAKIGVLDMSGNYAIISGDPYALCQSIFGLEVTGLLKANQCYSKYWLDKGSKEILGFRAPMTCHNNIRKMEVSHDEECQHWYKYMTTCLILNCQDTITHAENGADKDSDAFITTDNQVLLRNFRVTPAIFCMQKSVPKVKVTERLLLKSNKDGFGDKIGSITNKITAMFDVQAKFPKDSAEYKELEYRIMCGQHYQQCAIDRIKGIDFHDMPKEWFDFKACKPEVDEDGVIIDDEETLARKEFNMRIVANKKPYFFIYIYPELKREYVKTLNELDKKSYFNFGMKFKELYIKEEKTEEEQSFINYGLNVLPVTDNECTMNKICHAVENEFNGFKKVLKSDGFDYTILKTQKQYEASDYKAIDKLYKEYTKQVALFKEQAVKERMEKDDIKANLKVVLEDFRKQCDIKCPNKEDLCNILIDLTYTKEKTKQFAWDMCGRQIIENLLSNHDNTFNYVEMSEQGEHIYKGYKFELKQMKVMEE